MSEWNMGCMRRARGYMETLATLLACVYTAAILSPSAVVIAAESRQPKVTPVASASAQPSRHGATLQRLREQLRVLSGRPDAFHHTPSTGERRTSREALRTWRGQLQSLDADVEAQFAATGRMIHEKHLPAIIAQRQSQALATYRERYAALENDLDAIDKAPDEASAMARADSAFTRLDTERSQHSQPALDPRHLPFSRLKADPSRKPFTSRKQFLTAGLFSNPYLRVAQVGSFDYSQLPGAGNPAYLAATTEVTLSPAIQARAKALSYNPVQIYNWVRNNIAWQPTWGAVQDADLTLSAQRGNAFDISSLLIALLRASGIPARYVIGTINVPADQFRNWAGGFQNTDAAIQFASAGGIPISAVTTSAGQVTTVQMEHVWVEAAIDFVPSRGAVNRSADTWVPLDASYKQYTFQQGLDPVAIAGVDPAALLQQFTAAATIDTADGWVSGLDMGVLQTAQQNGTTALNNYITQNLPSATVGQVLGGPSVVQLAPEILAAGLPYQIVVKGATYGSLPAQLEQSITFSLGVDATGEPVNPVTFPWAQLNNQEVILSFTPATAADQQAIDSLIPSTPGTALPGSIPAYLINVIPQLTVNGQVLASGSPMTLGADMTFVFTPNFAGRYSTQNTYDVIAGSYLAVAVVAGNVAPQALSDLSSKLQQTQAILQAADPTQPQTLTQDRVLGDMFEAGLLNYYAQYLEGADRIGSKDAGHYALGAGTGTYGYEPDVDYVFGIPRDIRPGGAAMNVPIANISQVDSSDSSKTVNYRLQIGILSSALEGSVPWYMFGDRTQPPTAVSAAAALMMANQSGQKLYEITPANQGATLPNISHNATTMQDIANGLGAGDTIITSASDISVPGWTGGGYIIYDPQTGDGAYKIAGGQNGGFQGLSNSVLGNFLDLASSESRGLQVLLIKAEEDPAELPGEAMGQIADLAKSIVSVLASTSLHGQPCLLSSQSESLEGAIEALDALDWAGSANTAGPVVMLGQYLGYLYIVENAVYFARLNAAVGDCGLTGQ